VNRANKITDTGLMLFGKGLGNLKFLKKIDLNFAQSRGFTGEGILSLIRNFTRQVGLEDLRLNFSYCQKFSMKVFSRNLKRFRALKTLSLDFHPTIDNIEKAYLYLGEALNRLTSLQNISLSFRSCGDLTDKEFEYITENLKDFSSLQNISLDLSL